MYLLGVKANSGNEELKEKMRELMASITFKRFAPSKYPNYWLQFHYTLLQRTALGEEFHEDDVVDKIKPNAEVIDDRCGPLALEWKAILDEVAPGYGGAPIKEKRKAIKDETADEPKPKKTKLPAEAVSSDKIESLYEQGRLMNVFYLVFLTDDS
jgi:Ku70/Ku80 C-terminal arm